MSSAVPRGMTFATGCQAHEEDALALYKKLLVVVTDESIYLEEYARDRIRQEEMHALELRKMLRDYSD